MGFAENAPKGEKGLRNQQQCANKYLALLVVSITDVARCARDCTG